MMTTTEVHVGMAGSISCWTDVHPVTVVAFKGRRVAVQEDNWKVVSGSEFDGSAQYEYSPNPDAPIKWFSLRKNGRYVSVGGTIKNGYRLGLGHRRRYYDPHF